MKKFIPVLSSVLSTVLITWCSSAYAKNQLDGPLDTTEGAVSEEIMLAAGGSVQAVCSGNVPFKKLTVNDSNFNNILIDPESGQLQLVLDIKKETNKNILEFNYTILLDPEEIIDALLQGKTVQLSNENKENISLSLKSTDLKTGETIVVANEVRKLIESEGQNAIDTEEDVPINGSLQIKTKGNLASGILKLEFTNTNRMIEKASDVIGEPITIDENGKVRAIGRFTNIPINGSFQELSGFDLNNLPKGINLENIPDGIDLNNLPSKIKNILDFPAVENLSDLINIPTGFNLADIAKIPAGFAPGDLSKIPPGYGVEDLVKLPEGFNLNDFVKFPQGLDLNNLPPGFTINDLSFFPPLSNINDLPPGITPQDLKNLPGGIHLSDLTNLNPSDPNSVNLICEDGKIKTGLEPFIPVGVICPPSDLGDINPSTICVDGMIKPGYESYVPSGFDCSMLGQ